MMRRPLLAFGLFLAASGCSSSPFAPFERCEANCPQPPPVPPVVTWVLPTPGAVVGRTSALVVSVTDDLGVDRVEFYYTGSLYKLHPGSVGAAPYRVELGKYYDGFPINGSPITVYAIAWDVEGNADTAGINLNWSPSL